MSICLLFTPLHALKWGSIFDFASSSNLSSPNKPKEGSTVCAMNATCEGLAVSYESANSNKIWHHLESNIPLPLVEDLNKDLQWHIVNKDFIDAKNAHLYMCYLGLEDHKLLKYLLVSKIIENGKFSDAEQIISPCFEESSCFWCSLIETYVDIGDLPQALELFLKKRCDSSQLSKGALHSLIKCCTNLKSEKQGLQVHKILVQGGLDSDFVLATTLIEMYAECGLLMEAREVLDEMHMRDIFAWNVLCLGYADAGLDFEALQCLHLSKMEGLSPNSHTFVVALKICGKANFLEKGKELHSEITLKGLEQDSFVGSALLDMYARCGLLLEAEKVFEGLGEKDVVAWTAMISHYLENDQAISGLECFQKMQSKGVLPNPVTYMSALKACMCLGSLTMGQQLHSDLTEKGFENDVLVGGALVNMYAKHGWLAEAYAVFEKLPRKETNSLIALLSGYVEHGFDDKVFNISEGMQKHGVSLDPIVYVLTVEACTNARAFHKGLNIHCEIIKEEFESSNVVNSVLMDMYAKCGFLAESLEVFDDAPTQDVFLWTTRMTCLLEREHYKEALMCLEEMQKDGVSPNSVTYICALQACAHLQVMDMGRSVHAKITAAGFDEDLVVGNVLVDFYIKCGSIPESWEVFNQLHNKDIASWNTLIAGFIEFEVAQDVPTYLSRMQQDGISPNKITFLYLLKASSIIESKEEGRRAHTEVVKLGYDGDLLVDNTLVDVYTKLGSFSEAYDIFDKMVFRNVVSWNIMIAGCAERQLGREGLECLEQMSVDGVAPNISTLVCGLNCCTTIGALKAGQALYSNIIKIGFEIDAIVGSALIDMYACCGQLVDAQEVFAHLQIKNDAWSAIISGYEKHGQNEKALACFEDMLAQGVSLDNVTFASILRICGSVGAVVKGQEAHMMVTRAGREDDPLIATMLIDMYSRCGCLTDAYDLFEVLIDKDIVAWSALIAGFARYGECQKVIYLVGKMESSSLLLDAVALLSILTACSHVGLIDLGQSYFQANAESSVFSVREEHYNCMIDLLSRAGHLEMALLMILEMPWEPDTLTWSIIVGACRNWENSDLGYDIFQLTF